MRTKRIDLRKVPGEENPADLLTKHSISRQRLLDLVNLFGCRYLGGRADSAPLTRKGGSARATLADAGRALDAEAVGHVGSGAAPSLPHMAYSSEELDKAYPPLEAPPEEHLGDLEDDRADSTLQAGMQVAREIAENTRVHGRRRRPPEPKLAAPNSDEKTKHDSQQPKGHRGLQQRRQREHRGQHAGKHLELANVMGHTPRRSGKCGSTRTSPTDSDWPACLGKFQNLYQGLLVQI